MKYDNKLYYNLVCRWTEKHLKLKASKSKEYESNSPSWSGITFMVSTSPGSLSESDDDDTSLSYNPLWCVCNAVMLKFTQPPFTNLVPCHKNWGWPHNFNKTLESLHCATDFSVAQFSRLFPRTRNRRQNNENAIAKVLFSAKKAWGEVPGRVICRGCRAKWKTFQSRSLSKFSWYRVGILNLWHLVSKIKIYM